MWLRCIMHYACVKLKCFLLLIVFATSLNRVKSSNHLPPSLLKKVTNIFVKNVPIIKNCLMIHDFFPSKNWPPLLRGWGYRKFNWTNQKYIKCFLTLFYQNNFVVLKETITSNNKQNDLIILLKIVIIIIIKLKKEGMD